MQTRRGRRSFLLLPGHERRKAEKAATLDVDAVIFDIEDAVPATHKQAARACIRESLAEIDFGGRELMVRINAVSTDLWEQDLAALAELELAGLYLPKVERAGEVETFLKRCRDVAPSLERADVFATIETARGLTEVERIADVPGLSGLFFGSGDYALSTGIEISTETLNYPRARIAVAAAANAIQSVDVAYFRDVKDVAATEQDARDARALGFTGKVVFHPNQVAPVNAVFTPSDEEVARAERIIAAYEASSGSGKGVFLLDGEFVAIDIARMAERTLARAAATGALPRGRS